MIMSRKIILWAVISGLLAGLLGAFIFERFDNINTKEKLIKEFYNIENAVYVSPHGLRGKMDKGTNDYILVDLRSYEEYEKEHIIGAINIPAYKDKNTPAYEEIDRIVNAFRELGANKDIIVYCYSIPCMTGRKIGKLLADNGIYVKHLGIGWNEWRYYWNLWNHEHEWNITKTQDYVWQGSDAGIPKLRDATSCGVLGELGC